MMKSPETRAFLIHALIWAVVCAALAAINLMQTPVDGQQQNYWFQWPLFGWGIGVAAHGLGLWLKERKDNSPLLASDARRGFWVHLFAYVAVNAVLVAVDLKTSPGLQWVYWPIVAWGVGLAAHGFLVWRNYEAPPASRTVRTTASAASPARKSGTRKATKPKAKAVAAKGVRRAAKKPAARKTARGSPGGSRGKTRGKRGGTRRR